jgi:ubiquinone/menaquinone biosynthesis C-methylase UbiE
MINLKKITTSDLYGKYSFGNEYNYLLSDKSLNKSRKIIKADLVKAGVLKKIRNFKILDVGTGRQSLILSKLGAKSIEHFDISYDHVKRFQQILKNRFSQYDIKSQNADLTKFKLKKEYYDFVYLNGIVHHFENVHEGLYNCSNSLKIGGRIWCYFYRSGTFKWFVCSMIRKLIKNIDVEDAFKSLSIYFGKGETSNYTVGRIMDDFFVPHIHLFSANQYIDYMKDLGFKMVGNDNAYPLDDINHTKLHHSATIVFEKIKLTPSKSKISQKKCLTGKNTVNQLNEKYYRKSKILECIKEFKKILKKVNKFSDYKMWMLLLSMHELSAGQYYGKNELPPKYNELLKILKLANS